MARVLFTILLALAAGCGHFEHSVPEQVAPGPRAELQAAYDQTSAEVVAERDQASGWPSADDCDGVLWAGLLAAAGAPDVKLDLAELAPGVIGRRPGADCFREDRDGNGRVDSGSTTSNDMIMGYLWGTWRTRRMDLLEKFATACESRPVSVDGQFGCILGDPFPAEAARVVLRPNGLGLLGRVIYAVSGGSDKRTYRDLPAVYIGVPEEDYGRHLQALGIILNGEVHTQGPKQFGVLDVTPQEKDQLALLLQKDPNDWTAAAGLAVYTGDFQAVVGTLLDSGAPCPTYARGAALNCKVSWLFAARLVLNHLEEK